MAKVSTKKNWEDFWDPDKKVEEIYPTSESIVENLLKVTDVKGLKILEVGAGTGRDSIKLSQLGADVTVLDYTVNSLIKIKEALLTVDTELVFIRGDGTKLPFEDGSFDIIFHQGLLEHFHEPYNLFDENVRVLKKGGYLLIDVPQTFHVYTIIKKFLIMLDKWFAGWETQFSIGELRKFYNSGNLTIRHEYGDWMAPSLFYRIFREILKKVGLVLPMYPKPLPVLGKFRKSIRGFFINKNISKYTFLTIGIIGQKND